MIYYFIYFAIGYIVLGCFFAALENRINTNKRPEPFLVGILWPVILVGILLMLLVKLFEKLLSKIKF